MGDRANVYIHEDERPGVYLYTHWDGTELPNLVKEALLTDRAKRRINDAQYLTRILIEEVIARAGDYGSELGWGVSAEIGDGDDRIVDVNVGYSETTVTLKGYESEVCEHCGHEL